MIFLNCFYHVEKVEKWSYEEVRLTRWHSKAIRSAYFDLLYEVDKRHSVRGRKDIEHCIKMVG